MSKYRRPAPLKGSPDQKIEQLRRDIIALIEEVERDMNAKAGDERKEKEKKR